MSKHSRARAGPHGAPCWRLMVAAYPRDARGYFAAPRPSSIGALRSARLRRLYPPQRPKTGETAPLLSPLLLLRAGDEGAAATRWAARKAHGWAGLVLLCTFGTARSLAMALSSLATCFVHPPHPAAAPPHPTPPPKAKERTAVIRRMAGDRCRGTPGQRPWRWLCG